MSKIKEAVVTAKTWPEKRISAGDSDVSQTSSSGFDNTGVYVGDLPGMCGGSITVQEPKKRGEEIVDHPDHYKPSAPADRMKMIVKRIVDRGYIEVIDVIDAWDLSFSKGSCLKYILRQGKKDDDVTELEKAIWYLKNEIELLKGCK